MSERNDWFARPTSAFFLWCLPLILGFATFQIGLPPRAAAAIWSALFLWMGAGCLINAARCHRLHCYISGPIFFLGALAMGLLAVGVVLGPHALTNTVGFTLALALLSFVPEMIWRRYA
jgi:hypothetical protein